MPSVLSQVKQQDKWLPKQTCTDEPSANAVRTQNTYLSRQPDTKAHKLVSTTQVLILMLLKWRVLTDREGVGCNILLHWRRSWACRRCGRSLTNQYISTFLKKTQ